MKKYIPKVSEKETENVEGCISNLLKQVKAINSSLGFDILCNEDVCKTLKVTYKVLTEYRNEGLLSYSKVNDKYWYTSDDIDKFIKTTQNI